MAAHPEARRVPDVPEVVVGGEPFRPDPAIVLPAHAVAAVRAGRQPSERALRLAEASRLLDGATPMETGWARLDDGTLTVAVETRMPRVTGEMLDWWFAWHGGESARYCLWHPKDHLCAAWQRPVAWSRDWRAVYQTNVSDVDEWIGSFLQKLSIAFAPPERYLDASRFAAARVDTAVCARTALRDGGIAAGHVVHLVQRTDDGVVMRSRFWLGDFDAAGLGVAGRVLGPVLNTRLARERALPSRLGRDLLVHCAEEMHHLAGFLPALFRRAAR